MIKVDIQRNLIGLEDLLVGVGTVEQVRGPASTDPITITKINGENLPYDGVYSMGEKIDALQLQMDTLPEVVDQDGNLLTGLINTSTLDLDLENRLWRKTIDANIAELYYYDELLFQYNPTLGNLILPPDTDYIAADAVVTAAFEAADVILQANIDALDTATAAIQGLDVGVTADDLVQLDATGKLPAVDGSQVTGIIHPSGVPIGAIFQVPYSTPDTDYLECNGQAINRTTYADLFAKIGSDYGSGDGSTTFNIPDYRGEFLRGWDNSRGIDTGRALGSFQSEGYKSHTHDINSLTTDTSGEHTHGYIHGGSSSPPNVSSSSTGHNSDTTDPAGNHSHAISGSLGSSGDTETRPRNISVMYQIKVL